LTSSQRIAKRAFDLVVSLVGLLIILPVILIGWVFAAFSTRANGFFIQNRVGKNGDLFPLIKLRSMKQIEGLNSSVTADNDARITPVGRLLRKFKIDELPQLFNVLVGHMSLVGPRPDVPGFADQLEGDDRVILSIRPGITGPASIAFRKEEELLATVDDPEKYNLETIWPEKIRINKQYIREFSLLGDIKYIFQTALGG
jgi:lipopolysaccharide/colanic/teichoic acid biosynthesis glycosyltransferase